MDHEAIVIKIDKDRYKCLWANGSTFHLLKSEVKVLGNRIRVHDIISVKGISPSTRHALCPTLEVRRDMTWNDVITRNMTRDKKGLSIVPRIHFASKGERRHKKLRMQVTTKRKISPHSRKDKTFDKRSKVRVQLLSQHRKFFNEYAKAKQFDPLNTSRWYLTSQRAIKAWGGTEMLTKYYSGSHITALLKVYPELFLQREKFKGGKLHAKNNIKDETHPLLEQIPRF